MQCASSTAIRASSRLRSISTKPGTRSRSGAIKRNCNDPSRYSRHTWRLCSRSMPEWMRPTFRPNCDSFCAWSSHQRNQRRNHQRRSTTRERRQLIAERLTRAGRHDQQNIMARGRSLAHCLLIGAELREAEGAVQQREKAFGRHNRHTYLRTTFACVEAFHLPLLRQTLGVNLRVRAARQRRCSAEGTRSASWKAVSSRSYERRIVEDSCNRCWQGNSVLATDNM